MPCVHGSPIMPGLMTDSRLRGCTCGPCRQERTDGIQRETSSRPGKFVNLPSRDGKGLFVAAGEDAGCGISHFGAEYTGTPNHV